MRLKTIRERRDRPVTVMGICSLRVRIGIQRRPNGSASGPLVRDGVCLSMRVSQVGERLGGGLLDLQLKSIDQLAELCRQRLQRSIRKAH